LVDVRMEWDRSPSLEIVMSWSNENDDMVAFYSQVHTTCSIVRPCAIAPAASEVGVPATSSTLSKVQSAIVIRHVCCQVA
jgi:hypothetical protein